MNLFKKQSLVLFFPIYNSVTFCSVRTIYSLLFTKISNYFNIGDWDNATFQLNSFSDCFNINTHCSFTPNLILFAHPTEDKKGFSSDNSSINNDWWSCKHRVKFVFALTCQGASILKQPQWSSTFDFWVSFKENIYFTVKQRGQQKIISDLFSRLPKKIHGLTEKEEFYNAIKSEYLRAIEIVDSKDNGDNGYTVLLSVLNAGYESMVSSDEI